MFVMDDNVRVAHEANGTLRIKTWIVMDLYGLTLND